MFVDRRARSSKEEIINRINENVRYIEKTPEANQLMVFPEGITSKIGYIKPFKYGAFAPLSPITPVFMEVSTPYYETCYYFVNLLLDIFFTLAQPYCIMSITELQAVYPTEGTSVKEYLTDIHSLYSNKFNLESVKIDIMERDNFFKVVKNLE